MLSTSHQAILRVVKSGRKEMGRTCCTNEARRNAYSYLVGNRREGDHLKDPGVGGRIILKWIFEKWYGRN